MSVGLPTSKAEIDSRAGDLARSFQRDFNSITILKVYLDATPDSDLIALGYSAGEVATLKTAIADLEQLRNIWIGNNSLAVAKNFTQFVQRLWGVGAF